MSHAFPSDIAVHLPDSYRSHMSLISHVVLLQTLSGSRVQQCLKPPNQAHVLFSAAVASCALSVSVAVLLYNSVVCHPWG